MIRRRLGPALAWAAAFAPALLWLSADPTWGRAARAWRTSAVVGQIAGLMGLAAVGVTFVLAARIRPLEPWFGGLDGMVRTHHRLGLFAAGALIVHPAAHAVRFLPADLGRALMFVLPVHERLAVSLGALAGWGIVLLVALTFVKALPYHRWKWTHRALGLVLLVALAHAVSVEPTPGRPVAMRTSAALWIYVVGLGLGGLVAHLYRLVVVPLVARRNRYRVTSVRRPNPRVIEIELAAEGPALRFAPGQFVYTRFDAPGLSREAHPFTITSAPGAPTLSITVKALGDFTRTLHERLSEGAGAVLEGPYGCFDYRAGGDRQTWVAAGVGVAPFVSFARHLESGGERRDIRVYYCVHDRSDAVHLADLTAAAERVEGLEVVLVCSTERGHLTAAELGDLSGRDVFLCGPSRFRSDLVRQLAARGVRGSRVHVEDFELR